jgi:hypothetical protein
MFPVALVALLLACREPLAGSGKVEKDAPPAQKGSAASTVGARSSSSRSPRPPALDTPPAFDALQFWRCAAVTFGVALLVGGGWMLRNAHLYGDPLGTKAFEQYFQDTPTTDQMGQLLGYSGLELLTRKVLPLTFVSFWGVFGHMEKFMGTYPKGASTPTWASILADHGYPPASWLYPILLVVSLIAAAGLAWKVVQYWLFAPRTARFRTPNTQHPTPNSQRLIVVLSLAAFLVLAAFLRFNTEFFQAQGRYLFPAMAPLSFGFTAGWLVWWPNRRRALAVLFLLAGMLALALYALIAVLLPAFH